MLVTTDPVEVLGYGSWQNDDRSGPMSRRDGTTVDWVEVRADGYEKGAKRLTIAHSMNGGPRPEPGTLVRLQVNQTEELVPYTGIDRDGKQRPMNRVKTKYSVLAIEAVKTPARVAV